MEIRNSTCLHGEKYKIISKISQGNFGITYLAEQTCLDRKICIKEFFFKGSCERSQNGYVTVTTSGKDITESFRRKFIREAKRLSQFDHPNIVKVIDVFEENGTAYMVMDYIEGQTLQQIVDRKGKLTETEALAYIIPLCDALEVVHDKGLLHLDIKPSNILIKKKTNTPVLIDFGISKFTEASGDDNSTTTPVALTKGYAPLEQYGQDLVKLTSATDVYSVGATLYKLVTGITPPEAGIIVQDGIKSPSELNLIISEQLNAIILQALSVKTTHRHQSISILKADLMSISGKVDFKDIEEDTEVIGEVRIPFTTIEPNPQRPIKKRKRVVALWIFFSISILIALFFLAKALIVKKETIQRVNEIKRSQEYAPQKNSPNPYIDRLGNPSENEKPLLLQSTNNDQSLTDIDGNVYKTVKIGSQVWMAENLKVTKYNDAISIPLETDSRSWENLTTHGYCWYDNDPANNKNTYGALYNWYTVNSGVLCPTGWHIPTDTEWTTLTTYLGGDAIAGGKLKEKDTSHWLSPNAGATNETVFTAVPGGCRNSNGIFQDIGYGGYWWTLTENSSEKAWYRAMGYDHSGTSRNNFGSKRDGYSVRCLRDF